jgi:hypothetical protein
VVSIATSKTTVNPSESFTISWSSLNIGGATCGGCLDGQVSINQSMGCKAGNTAGSQSQSKVTPGVYTYEITGCNTCGTAVASVQVEVVAPASCGASQPSCVEVEPEAGYSNINEMICNYTGGVVCDVVGRFCAALWSGKLVRTANFGGCDFVAGSTNTIVGCNEASCDAMAFGGAFVRFDSISVPNKWVLRISAQTFAGGGSGSGVTLWEGEKLNGSGPDGVYTKTDGCATGPSTLEVSAITCP